ncbi:MAG: hypothetical protein CMR00_11235 [[Chlorobium] sp. 445]|nr:MAG: hypothetical protein CMR00_11235 [[Chlorobium] sp. 445]
MFQANRLECSSAAPSTIYQESANVDEQLSAAERSSIKIKKATLCIAYKYKRTYKRIARVSNQPICRAAMKVA